MPSSGLVITSDTLTPGLKKFPTTVEKAVAETVEFFTPRVEGSARSNAPWTDQTGNARNGLRANAFHEPPVRHGIILAHSVPYGIWLEVRWEGKYAIIVPTIKEQGRVLMATMNKLFRRMRAI